MTMPLRIAIVGDGVLAAQAALTLAQLGRDRVAVTIVGAGGTREGLGPIGPAVIALPEWLRGAAIAPHAAEILATTPGASLSHGIAFDGWTRPGAAWFLPFGDTGAPLRGLPFHQLAAKARATGNTIRLGDYALAAMAAQSGRFAFPADDSRSPLSTLDFGQHFPANAFAGTLAQIATRCGASGASAPLRHVETCDDGIAALVLSDETRIVADLYLDCSGAEALLVGEPLGIAVEEWDVLPPAWIVTRLTPLNGPTPPYALNGAKPDGWSLEVPLDGAIGAVDLVFGEGGPADATRLRTGARRKAWSGNCVALGAAAAINEPLFGAQLLAAQVMLDHLVRLLPANGTRQTTVAEFNRLSRAQAERLRDDATALWITNGRSGEPLWDAARTQPPSVDLKRRLDLFASRGVVPEYDDELFGPEDWVMMLHGQGLRPRRIDPLAASITEDEIMRHCTALRTRLTEALATMPPLAVVLNELRRARP